MDPTETGNPPSPPMISSQTSGESTAISPATDPAAWRADIADEYRSVAEKFTTPADVVKSYAELERKLGGSVKPPGDGADPAELDAFYKRLGRPDSPDGYTIKPTDGIPEDVHNNPANAEVRNRFLGTAHEAGLTQDQAQAVIDFYYGEVTGGVAAVDTDELEAGLRREWGSDYEKNIEYGERAYRAFTDAETADKLESIMGDTSLLRMFARIGRQMGEASDVSTEGAALGEQQQRTLDREMREIIGSNDYWSNETKQRRVRDISVKLFGSRPITGAAPNQNWK